MTDSRKMMDRLDANPSGLVAGQESNSPATEMRRTTRLSIAVPVTVSGKDAGGETFQEETNTLNINKLGALLALHRRVDIGSELIIENRFLEISLRARVISFQNRMSAADPDHVGIELVELKNIWGIQYPPKDWLRPLQQRNVPDAASPSPTSAQNVIPTSAPATAAPTALQGAAVSPQPAAVTSKPIPVRPATVEIDLGAFEKQAEQSAEALLKTFGAKLAKLGAQMGTRIQSGLKEAADRVQEKEQTLSALDAKLSSLSETLEGTLARAETTLTSAQDIAQRTGQETKLREDEFRLQLQQMLGSALEDFDQRINQRVLASTSAQKEQHSRLQQETVESLNEIQHRLREQAETVSKEVLTNLPVEIERNRGEAMGQISGMAEEKLNAAIQRFEQRLESLASKTQETAAEQMRVETLAKLTPELAARQAEAVDHTQSQVKLTLAAALAEFEQRLQTTATQAQESVSERLKAETLSKLLPELVGRQVEAIDQTRERVRQTVEVSLSDFQQRLRDTATQTQDAAAERVRVEALAKLAPELESRRALAIDQTQRQVKQTLEAALGEFEQRLQATATQAHQSASEQLRAEGLAKLAPELESRRALAIDQTQRQVKQTLEAALGEFEQRLQATATQAHQSASEHLQAEALAKLAPELESRQALAIDQAQRQVKQTLEAALGEFEQRLQATATQAHQSASERLSEEILGRLTPQLEARHSEALQQTNDRVQRDLTNALSSFQEGLRTASAQAHQAAMERLSAGTMAGLSAQLESRQLEVVEQTQRQIADRFQSSLEEFEKRLQSAAAQTESVAVEGLRTEFIAALKPELELCQTDTLQQARRQTQQTLEAALGEFRQQLHLAAGQAQETATEQLSAGILTKLVPQLEARQSEVVEQAQRQIADQFQSSLEEFEKRLQSAAAQTESVAVEGLRTEFIAALKPELELCQTDTLQHVRGQTQQTLEAALGEFRQQLQLSAGQAQETATEQLSAGILTKLVPQLEARQSETLDETRQRVQQTLEHSLREFNSQLQAAADQARQTASENLTAQIVGQLQPELESRQSAAVSQTAERVQETVRVGLDGFERSLQAATAQAQQAALERLTSEAHARLTPVLEAQRAEVLETIRHQSVAEVESSIRSLREHLANEVAECWKSADSLLQKPSEMIRKYAEDTMSMLREEMIAVRVSTIESAKLEVRAMMRSTLTSLNEEANAFSVEFRGQIKSAWESMKNRGLDELESLHQEAIGKHRESVLERLQKDAEDLTHAAVGQFRAQSEEAIREANNAINKQVGAAAFLLKDWMDQATTRLERCLEKVETRAETAFEAAQARSLKMQMGMMERVQRESEEIALELYDRFQQAASALRRGQPRMAEEPAQAGGNPGEEPKISHVPSVLEG